MQEAKKHSNKTKKDPEREQEAQKYANPIASRKFIMQHLQEVGKAVSFDHLVKALGLESSNEKQDALRKRLDAMIRDAQIIKNRKGSYALVNKLSLISGRIIVNREGNGFLLPDSGAKRIFLNAQQMRLVLPEDKVLASVNITAKENIEAIIVEILERGVTQVVGRFNEKKGIAFVSPINKELSRDIIIPYDKRGGALPGQFVVAKIISYPSRETKDYNIIGEITEILGEHLGTGMEIAVAIRSYELPHTWNENVLNEIAAIPRDFTVKMREGRKTLQDLPFVTIDGEDARDFDDAVYCEKMLNGDYVLYVAIADVGYYVKPNSAIDLEAANRGNSVYFPGHVVPMLPEVLSNELCSLKPAVERFVVVCEIRLSNKGKILNYKFYEAVIKSHARLTYNEVFAILEGKKAEHQELLPHLETLKEVFHLLLRQRKIRGALEFETVETKIIFNDKQQIDRIVPTQRNYVHLIIEECMLAANFCASQFLSEHKKLAVLYRIHEGPDSEKLKTLRSFLRVLGLTLKGGDNPTPLHFSILLKQIEGRKDEALIETLVLRSMRRALYSRKNIGHFGLAYEGYVHFTSPIRRYPDLLIHRAIHFVINKGKLSGFHYGENAVDNFADYCSMTERRADDATRDAVYALKCSFMKEKLGQKFLGTVTNATNFGLFVVLDDVYVEGLLHVTSLENDYYSFDPQRIMLKGKRTGKTYKIGDKIKVLVARVDVDSREIDFELM